MSELARQVGVTRQAMHMFEKGVSKPGADTVRQLALVLRVQPPFFFNPPRELAPRTAPLNFRSLINASKRARNEAAAKEEWLSEIATHYAEHLDLPEPNVPDFGIEDFEALTSDDIEDLALRLRRFWGLGNGPISNVVRLMENNGILVARLRLKDEMDGASSWRGHWPIVLLNSTNTAVRSRFDAAHELGHLVMHRDVSEEDLENKPLYRHIEKQAHRFASAFLMPAEGFVKELTTLDMRGLLDLKPRWRCSVAGMGYRLKDLKLISEGSFIYLIRKLSAQPGGRKREPLDDRIEAETPVLMSRALEMLATNGILQGADLVRAVGLGVADIAELVGAPHSALLASDDAADKVIPLRVRR